LHPLDLGLKNWARVAASKATSYCIISTNLGKGTPVQMVIESPHCKIETEIHSQTYLWIVVLRIHNLQTKDFCPNSCARLARRKTSS